MKKWHSALLASITLVLGIVIGSICFFLLNDIATDYNAYSMYTFSMESYANGNDNQAIRQLTYARGLAPEWYGPDFQLGKILLEKECSDVARFFLEEARWKYDERPKWRFNVADESHSAEIDALLERLPPAE